MIKLIYDLIVNLLPDNFTTYRNDDAVVVYDRAVWKMESKDDAILLIKKNICNMSIINC